MKKTAAGYTSFEPKERDVDGWDVKPRNSPFERPKGGWQKSDFGFVYDPSPKSYTYGLVTNEVEDLGLPAGDKKDGQWLAVIMDERRDFANNLPEDAIDAEAFTTMHEARAWVESWFEEHEQNDVFASKKQASSHRLARGFHSRWNESDMYDFVDGAIDDINRNTYSDIMAGNLNSYEGADGEVYTFDIMSDYFTLYVEVDGTNVSISCEDDPSLDQAWDFDEDYSSSNLAEDLYGIADDAEEVFIEMSEEEASDGFDF